MGGEHSREAETVGAEVTEDYEGSENPANNEGGAEKEEDILGRDSPRPSICSDGDLPYISYTVNRPIGDSPKRVAKGVRALRSSTSGVGGSFQKKRGLMRPQEVVVVKEGNANKTTVDRDLARLQNIPTFLPIMRGALTAPSARDPEVLERLDTGALSELCKRYQYHLHANASFISRHQDKLTARIRDTDSQVNDIANTVTERQRTYAKYAERLSQVTEVSHLLTRCHASLNLILESLETLNNCLPLEDRLEPFIWTTG